jgi:hypothetical protein
MHVPTAPSRNKALPESDSDETQTIQVILEWTARTAQQAHTRPKLMQMLSYFVSRP